MKTINYFYCLNILLLCFISSKEKDDSCPNGMRKTYVDDISMNQYGSGRAFMAAACFFQYPGSLFFKRKVLAFHYLYSNFIKDKICRRINIKF